MSPDDKLLVQAVGSVFLLNKPKAIGVAVSGGGDSVALLHLLHQWATEQGVKLQAVTVDHGLRKAAADEAKGVAELCAGLGIAHTTLNWQGWNGKGNLQDQARRARYRLMADWAKSQAIEAIALGHTADDQAETFLMRLARGSGVDGLSGMQQFRKTDGISWVRPALLLYRADLRNYLVRHNIEWIEDPSNEDERFERVKARKVIQALTPLGLDVERLASTARDLQMARQALAIQTQDAAVACATVMEGDVILARVGFNMLPAEIHSRLLSHALCWVSRAEYRPRRTALTEIQMALLMGKSSTLHGCRILVNKAEIRVTREHQAVKDTVCSSDAIWDMRWEFSGPHVDGLEIKALGEAGLAVCPDWRSTKIPRASLLATPAVWQNQTLIAAPLAGLANGWGANALFGPDHFISSIISH